MLWLSEENSGGLPYSGSTETDWTVINPNQGSVGYHNNGTGRPIRFEVEDLKCICLSPISDSNGNNIHLFSLCLNCLNIIFL